MAKVTICVLLYGDYSTLARRSLEGIRRHCARDDYQLIVGANAVGESTRRYIHLLLARNEIDVLIDSDVNLNKCPMMRRMFAAARSPLTWWFDDDSHVVASDALSRWVDAAQADPESTAMWGQAGVCDHPLAFAPDLPNVVSFVRKADWYCGLPPPSARPGGKGEFDFEGRGTGDPRWFFMLGGCWMIRTSVIRALDWPDRRLIKMGDDVLLGEAVRQQGWNLGNIGCPGVALNTEPRRGHAGCRSDWTMQGAAEKGTLHEVHD